MKHNTIFNSELTGVLKVLKDEEDGLLRFKMKDSRSMIVVAKAKLLCGYHCILSFLLMRANIGW